MIRIGRGHFVRQPNLLAGRGFGKTHHCALPMACRAALCRKYTGLRPGERATVLFLGPITNQADINERAFLEVMRSSSTLSSFLPVFPRRDKISLKNSVDVIVMKCDRRSLRGFPIVFCCAEELNFWRSEADATVNPAEEVLAAVTPALMRFEYGRLAMISSAWAMDGPMMANYKRRLETRDPLVLQMSTMQGNPTIPPALFELERQRDPEKFEREIMAIPSDGSATALLPGEALDRCIVRDRWENPPRPGASCVMGLDIGFRVDASGACWSHAEGETVVVDRVRSWKPKPGKPVQFAPMMEEIVEICRHYGCTRVFSDQICNEVVRQCLAAEGISVEQVSTLGRRASGIYSSLRAKVLAGQVELLDNTELLSQLRRLEIVRTSGGNERCEASSGHDDIAVACALSVYQCVSEPAFEPYAYCLDLPGASQSLGLSSPSPAVSVGRPRPVPTEPLDPSDDGPSRWWQSMG
jgi:hypothetical protein